MHNKRFAFPLLLIICCITTHLAAQEIGSFTRQQNGITISLHKALPNFVNRVRLKVINPHIIQVSAAIDSFSTAISLMAIDQQMQPVAWNIEERGSNILLNTDFITATVSLTNGEIHFSDKSGRSLLSEASTGRTLIPTINEGIPAYSLKQVFQSDTGEAYYGLGQHQSDLMNYKNRQVVLLQNNTEVAVPFVVSDKHYGVLWDNYSITTVGDTRARLPLSALKLYSKQNDEGWLTATYANKSNPSVVYHQRPESVIDYAFLQNLKTFPDSFPAAEGKVTWEGSIESGFSGLHQFFLNYAGYIKLWVDGKLMADRWRQSWNSGSAIIDLDMRKGNKYQLKVEWIPDGGESYLTLNWLPPVTDAEKKTFTFDSEAGKEINYYFIHGEKIDDIIKGYRQVTGKAVMVPKWAMGFWQSRERYKTQEEILNTVKTFREKQIPLDNIVLDWSYWKQEEWGSQEFDSSRFPDAAAMIKTLHEKYHTNFMISVWPKFYEGISSYHDFNNKGWLYKRSIADKQRDWIAKGYVSTFYDAFNAEARTGFWNLINQKLYSKGVDAWWMDASEPDILSNTNIEHRKELMTPTAIGSATAFYNAYPLQNAKGIYEGQRATNASKRVFILTRSAYAGMQRYAAATWSGDIGARWEDLKTQIAAGVNFSMSGLPYWTSDIGGFAVESRFENAQGALLEEWREQMTRWFQFGAFCPLFRVHGQFPFREVFNVAPDNHPAYQSMLYYNKLRYRMMPYIYSLTGMVYHDDYTIMRGLAMDFPDDKNVKNIADQFMFGPSLLINPVYTKAAVTRDLYLPQGGWYDLYTGTWLRGGQQIKAAAPYNQMPVYVKEGAIIPFGPALQYTSEKAADPVTLFVYTGSDGHFTLYEDEGTNYNYEQGRFSRIRFDYKEDSKTLTIHKREGNFAGMLQKRTFRVVWISKSKPATLDFDKQTDASIQYTGAEKKVTIK